MLEFLQVYLPIIIYILLIVFLSVAIVLAFKMINTITKVDKIVDSVSDKVESLNGIFKIVDIISDSVTGITDKVVECIMVFVKKFFHKKEKIESEDKNEKK